MSAAPLGISGRVARFFLTNQLTPLLALAGMLLGLFAVLVTPREEEPQIDVTMANVIVPFPGASAAEVESLIAEPMEQVLAEISDVKHLYSVSRPGASVLTVEFEVGVPRNTAIVRLYNAIFSNLDMPPSNLGWLQPIIKPKGIDDVPVVTVTLWTRDPGRGSYDLGKIAHALEGELKRVQGARNVYTIGGPDDIVHVELDPQRLAGHGLTATELVARLEAANVVRHAGGLVGEGLETPVQAGTFLAGREDVAGLVVGLSDGRPVFLEDVARVTAGPDQPGLVGEHDELGAVAQVVAREHFADVALDRGLGEVQLGGDLLVRQTPGHAAHHVGLPLGQPERGAVAARLLGQVALDESLGDPRGEQRVAGGHCSDPAPELLARDALEQEAAGSGAQGGEDDLVELHCGQHQDPGLPAERNDLPRRVDPVAAGHPHVHQHDVGGCAAHGLERGVGVPSRGHHLEVRGAADDRCQTVADKLLVVDDRDPDHGAGPCTVVAVVPGCVTSSGSTAVSENPPSGVGPAVSRPPSAATRSRRPSRPRPVLP